MSNWRAERFEEVKALTRQILEERYGKPTKCFDDYEADNKEYETEDRSYDDDPDDCFFD